MVKRYLPESTSPTAMLEWIYGPYVLASNYDALAARCAELETALRQMIEPPAGTSSDTGLALRIERSREVLERTADNGSPRQPPAYDAADWADDKPRTADSGDEPRRVYKCGRCGNIWEGADIGCPTCGLVNEVARRASDSASAERKCPRCGARGGRHWMDCDLYEQP